MGLTARNAILMRGDHPSESSVAAATTAISAAAPVTASTAIA
jgi:hypothetical protein